MHGPYKAFIRKIVRLSTACLFHRAALLKSDGVGVVVDGATVDDYRFTQPCKVFTPEGAIRSSGGVDVSADNVHGAQRLYGGVIRSPGRSRAAEGTLFSRPSPH